MIRKVLLGALTLAACSSPQSSSPTPPGGDPPGGGGAPVEVRRDPAPTPAPAATNRPKYGSFGFDLAGMDRSVAPGDDFFTYAAGTWVKTTEIPGDRGSLNAFAVLAEQAATRTRAIIEGVAKANAADGSNERKIADYYNTYLDVAGIEAAGTKPLKADLDRIAAVKTRQDLARVLGTTLRNDVDALNSTDYYTPNLFGLWVAEDMNDTSRYRPYLMQGGLGLPDREYYVGKAPKYGEIRKQYTAHIAAMLKLAGLDHVDKRAAGIVALETAIAKVHWTVDATGDVQKANTVWKREELGKRAPGLDWAAFLEGAGLGAQPVLGAWQSSAIAGIAKLVGSQPIDTWKDWLVFHEVQEMSAVLPNAFDDQSFAFYGTTLQGTPTQRERWKRAVEATGNALGEAVGKLYVERHFSPAAKAKVEAMVKNILTAFEARIDKLDWMSAPTKAKAKEKLARFQVGVGYPAQWIDYGKLEVVKGDAYGNARRASRFSYQRDLGKLGQPVDRDEWFLLPQEVNALNMPMQNMIIFPAAILEPTFFDPNADDAVNYGAIGAVIGHEVVHGFDDIGALFDARGNLKNWWAASDMTQFKTRGKALAAQYSAYKPLPDLALNGDQVLGENIADLAGVAVAYDAYRLSLGGKEAPVLEGFTGDQRFFLGWAQSWRSKFREPALRNAVLTGVHSPGPFRAATVRNQDAWYPAFDVKDGQKLALPPAQRVRIW